jgi:hypothetical protein
MRLDTYTGVDIVAAGFPPIKKSKNGSYYNLIWLMVTKNCYAAAYASPLHNAVATNAN